MRVTTSRERSLVALLILIAVVAGIWLVVIGPVVAGFSDRAERRAELLQQYQVSQRITGSIPRLRRQAERQRDTMRSFVFTAPTVADASTALQERVQRTIEGGGGELRAIDNVDSSSHHARVQVSAKMTLQQLTDMLAKIQNDTPYLLVEALSITSDDALISGKLDTMEIGFEVSLPTVVAKPR